MDPKDCARGGARRGGRVCPCLELKILANYRLGADASFSSLFPAGGPQCLSSGVSLRVVADRRLVQALSEKWWVKTGGHRQIDRDEDRQAERKAEIGRKNRD